MVFCMRKFQTEKFRRATLKIYIYCQDSIYIRRRTARFTGKFLGEELSELRIVLEKLSGRRIEGRKFPLC
jgi:hypothetical protein